MTQNHPKKGPRSPQDGRSPKNHTHQHENPSQGLTGAPACAAETAIVRHALLRKAAA